MLSFDFLQPGDLQHGLCNGFAALSIRKKLATQFDHFGQVHPQLCQLPILQTVKVCVQSAAQVHHQSGRMPSEKRARISVELAGAYHGDEHIRRFYAHQEICAKFKQNWFFLIHPALWEPPAI